MIQRRTKIHPIRGHFFTVYKLCVVVNAGIYDLGRSRNEVATSQPRHFGSRPSSSRPSNGWDCRR